MREREREKEKRDIAQIDVGAHTSIGRNLDNSPEIPYVESL